MKLLPLSLGLFAKVSDTDFSRVQRFKWSAQKGRRTFYAFRTERQNGVKRKIYLHQIVKPGYALDHKNGDGLDNRRGNLRPATVAQNKAAFRAKLPTSSSVFRGVRWNPRRGCWSAQITVNYKQKHLGVFQLEKEAARVYNTAALKSFGRFAHLNTL